MKRNEYEKDLRERQKRHLDSVRGREQEDFQPCLHDRCPQCVGTGIKKDGTRCIHMISCPCPKCNPHF